MDYPSCRDGTPCWRRWAPASAAIAKPAPSPRRSWPKGPAAPPCISGIERGLRNPGIFNVARQAMTKGAGARALRGILEKLMLGQMFEIPGSTDVAAVTVNAAVVRGEAAPILTRREASAAA
jgi:hypothetical protein